MSTAQTLAVLFPEPARFSPSNIAPVKFPGVSADSTDALRKILVHNYQNHHIFFNEIRFHNHATHHLISIYAMGANSELLDAAYETHKVYQRKAFQSPGPINAENFADHVGDEKYYQSYLKFFSDELLNKGTSRTLETYLYSKQTNFGDEEGKKPTLMFSRFIGGIFHPFIHLGYGLEFGLPGMVAEGLALTAVEPPFMGVVVPRSYWVGSEDTINSVISRVSSLALDHVPGINGQATSTSKNELSVFNVIALMQKDSSLSSDSLRDATSSMANSLNLVGEKIRTYSEMWSLNITENSDPQREVERKIEELAWAAVAIYSLAGWSKDKPFRADFFFMHIVTSSMFLPSLAAYLPTYVTQILLRTYFSAALTTWVSRGRPTISISKEFMNSVSASPQEPGATINPVKDTLTPKTATPNPWLASTQSILQHPAEHLCKIQRSLMHWAVLFGGRSAGYWENGKENIDGIELLDGSLFVRAAGLTLDALGWMREGQEEGEWSRLLFE